MDLLPSLLWRPMGAERMHALIVKASVGSKRADEDTVTDTQTDHFIIIAVLCIFQCLITVASHARRAKHEQRSKYWIIQDIVTFVGMQIAQALSGS